MAGPRRSAETAAIPRNGTAAPHILIVEARYYDEIADQLLTGATGAVKAAGGTFDVLTVPGALEIPAAVAIAITVLLFHLIGPSRTRLVAQILAAVIGAGFVIALQIAAILSYGTLSRFAVLSSDAVAAYAPDPDSPIWWPAYAAIGNGEALSLLLALSLVLLGGVMAIFSARFADTAITAASTATQVPHCT